MLAATRSQGLTRCLERLGTDGIEPLGGQALRQPNRLKPRIQPTATLLPEGIPSWQVSE